MVHPPRSSGARDGCRRSELTSNSDLVVVLGGDGTLLSVTHGPINGTPILGINMGTLGFLTEHPAEQLFPMLHAAIEGRATLERRERLEVTVHTPGEPETPALGPQRRGDQQVGPRADAGPVHARRRPVRQPVQGGRSDRGNPHRIHRLQPLGRRTDSLSDPRGAPGHPDLSAHPDQPAHRPVPRLGDRASGWRASRRRSSSPSTASRAFP